MILYPLVVALATLATGFVVAFALRRLSTLRLQLIGLGLLGAALPVAAVLLAGFIMLEPNYHAPVVVVGSGVGIAALVAALVVGRPLLRAADDLRTAATTFASGDLATRAPTAGPVELADVGASFNEMAQSLAQLFDARRELVAWASHDLRTPLANMQAMLEAVEDGLAAPADYVPELHDQVRVLSSLVDDLFELARIDSGTLTLELRRTELGGVIRSCVRGIEAEARSRGISVAADLDGEVAARCNPNHVRRVLLNLLANALRHTPTDGSIAVLVRSQRDEVCVMVEDTGDGLTADALRRMFERFWRGDPARSTRGAGLGLAIARGLVEAHGGRIWAENRAEGGARVSFTLPAG